MATQYTSILKLALPVQGELSGTWGDVVNDNITSMVEEAVAGRAVINTWTTNSHVLTTADGTTSEARCAMLEFTDTGTALTGAATVVCPTVSKLYVCKNDSGQQVTVKTAAGTGVAIPDGQTMFVFCDGTNVEPCATNFNSLSFNGYTLNFGGAVTTAGAFTTAGAYALTLTTTGTTNVTLPTTGTLATLAGTETLTNKTLTGPTISSPTITGSISATDITISGNTTIGDTSGDSLTVNATVTSNLIFTDDTYDIGALGANRPRNLYLSGSATIGGTTTMSGAVDITGALGVDGNFDVNTNKFTVASATGNTVIAGTLDVTGTVTTTGGLVTDTIAERTATTGVTVDGVLLKDGGATFTADVLFGDSDKAIFGAGSDLQIYHDGSNSYIADNGTGLLQLRTNGTEINLAAQSGTEFMARFQQNGAVNLYYDNSEKFKTTSTGIDVTGTVTSDGLTVAGNVRVDGNIQRDSVSAGSTGARVEEIGLGYGDAGNSWSGIWFNNQFANNAESAILLKTHNGTSTTLRQKIESNGDISFYEDTGTTAKFFWDASAERLGIGTSSPAQLLHIENSSTSAYAQVTSGTSSIAGVLLGDTLNNSIGRLSYDNSNNSLQLWTSAAERMRIDSGGNVGIGTSSPAAQSALHVVNNSGVASRVVGNGSSSTNFGIGNTTTGTAQLLLDGSNGDFAGGDYVVVSQRNDLAGEFKNVGPNPLVFSTSNVERMRIDSSGNVLVGKTTTAIGTAGAVIGVGNITSTYNGTVLDLNRLTTSGAIINLQKDGTAVGNIGVDSGGGLYVDFGDWTITESGGSLYFATGGTNKMKLDASGNLDVVGNVNANATIT